jgi:competence protein ComEA
MKFLEKFARKIGVTQTELKVFLFLITVFIFGITIKYLRLENEDFQKKNFDYTFLDSIFHSSNNVKSEQVNNNLFDSNLESLDFSTSNLEVNKKKQELPEKSINLNQASLDELMLLPGVGIETAKRILTYRRANGGFNNVEELLEVKGIGELKYNKIEKYIFVQ